MPNQEEVIGIVVDHQDGQVIVGHGYSLLARKQRPAWYVERLLLSAKGPLPVVCNRVFDRREYLCHLLLEILGVNVFDDISIRQSATGILQRRFEGREEDGGDWAPSGALYLTQKVPSLKPFEIGVEQDQIGGVLFQKDKQGVPAIDTAHLMSHLGHFGQEKIQQEVLVID